MAGIIKTTAMTNGAGRASKPKSRMVTFKVSPSMRATIDAKFPPPSPAPLEMVKAESTSSNTPQHLPVYDGSPAQTASTSNGTPIPTGADDAMAMPPPSEMPVKKGRGGGKRKSDMGADGLPKPRGKPGPKKRKLDDGSVDSPAGAKGPAHKLGPKANQGAINAGLRALDRSGTPCRKWSKGTFTVKTFTGTVWEVPRWRAPPKTNVTGKADGNASTGSSSKENKDNSQVGSEASIGAGPQGDASSIGVPASSPAPSVLPQASAVSASA